MNKPHFTVVRVTADNYPRFDDMVYWREHGCERAPSDIPVPGHIARELSNPNLRLYAAECGGRFVGWISLIYLPKVGKWNGHGHVYVDELWTEPSHRRLGIAKALMAKAEETCAEFGAHGVRLYVNVGNPGAKALYESCGYTEDGQAYFMEK